MTRRRAAVGRARAGLVGLAAVGGVLAGCSALPALPAPVPTTLAPSVAPAPTSSAVVSPDGFDAARRIAVRIRNIGCEGALETGSGFALDDHTIVTNKHVVAGTSTLQVSTYDGRDLTATGAATAGPADLAIVRTTDTLPTAPVLADADAKVGDAVTVVGYPLGRALTVTPGKVVDEHPDPLHQTSGQILVTDAPVEPGSSGSAVLDADGQVVGVVYAKDENGHSFVVPVSTLKAMLDDKTAFTPVTPCTN